MIEGGRKEHEKLFQRLLDEPHTFDQLEFENLMGNTFKSRLSFNDEVRIIEKRLRKTTGDPLERDAVLAIIEGDDVGAIRLCNMLKRRNQLGLRVLVSRLPPQ